MSHPLLRPKKALDAVNEELMEPTRDPRADEQDYNSPFAAKGTEFSETKMGQAKTGALPAGIGPLDYIKLAEAIAGTLEYLATIAPKGGDIQAFAIHGGPDLREFVADAKLVEKNKLLNKHMGSQSRGSRLAAPLVGQPQYYSIGCCVNLDGDSINEMTDEATDVTYRELAKNCEGIAEWVKDAGYGRQNGLSITKDWSVSFHKSKYQGVPCYYIDHSAIEYVWTLRGATGMKQAQVEEHIDPKILPPRQDLRRHLDEDLKTELKDDLAATRPVQAL